MGWVIRIVALCILLAFMACSGAARPPAQPSASTPATSSSASTTASDNPAKRKALYFPNAKVYGERPEAAYQKALEQGYKG